MAVNHRIVNRRLLSQGQVLRLYFEGGGARDIDLSAMAKRGPAYVRVLEREYQQGLRRIEDGHLLEWPDGMTWSADALWKEGAPARQSTSRAA